MTGEYIFTLRRVAWRNDRREDRLYRSELGLMKWLKLDHDSINMEEVKVINLSKKALK